MGGFAEFSLGVGSSLVAAFLGWLITIYTGKYLASRGVDLVGSWGEELVDEPDGKCGAGRILFDRRRKIYLYNGNCYLSDGTKYSHWETMQSYFNRENKTIYYIYYGKLYDKPGSDHYGFGAIHLTEIDSRLTPTGGYFISPHVDGTIKVHSMFRLPFEFRSEDSGEKLINHIISKR